MNRKELFGIFKTSFRNWLDNNATLRAAALTFFIILPLPTLLLVIVGFFSLFFGQSQSIEIVASQISAVAGPAVAGLFSQLLTDAASPFSSLWTAVIVVGFSMGGAIGAFSVLRDTMDCMWEVMLPKKHPLWKRIRQKIVPFILVSALGVIVLAWTTMSSGLYRVIMLFSINGTLATIGITVAQILLSFGVSTLLLAIIYKMIPDARVHWQDVILASVVSGIAFTATNYIFGTYISAFTVTTLSGAAGSLLVVLLWIFILNEIVLFGAEISQVHATTVGEHAKQHLPEPVGKVVELIEKAGEIIEDVTKEEVVKIPDAPQELQTPTSVSTETKQGAQQQDLEPITTQRSEPQEAEKPDNLKQENTEDLGEKRREGSLEVSIKIKTPEKKEESQT